MPGMRPRKELHLIVIDAAGNCVSHDVRQLSDDDLPTVGLMAHGSGAPLYVGEIRAEVREVIE